MLSTSRAPSIPATIGNVVSTMGTAPRRPAQEMNACSRQGIGKGSRQSRTETGRATSSRTDPTTSAGMIAEGSSLGSTSRPSMTNRPIWASHPTPSAKERVAARCGSWELPSTRPDR